MVSSRIVSLDGTDELNGFFVKSAVACFVNSFLVAPVEFGGGNDVAKGCPAMKQHARHLCQKDCSKENDKNQANGFQLKVSIGNFHGRSHLRK